MTNNQFPKNFKRKKENFKCEKCGEEVKGNGYTDHCPKCLWGKHVDDQIPGDRASECRDLMEPIGAQFNPPGGGPNLKFKIKYQCQKCSHTFEVWSAEGDDREKLIQLSVISN